MWFLLLLFGISVSALVVGSIALARENNRRKDEDGERVEKLKDQVNEAYDVVEVISQQAWIDPFTSDAAIDLHQSAPLSTTGSKLTVTGFYTVTVPLAEEDRDIKIVDWCLYSSTVKNSVPGTAAAPYNLFTQKYDKEDIVVEFEEDGVSSQQHATGNYPVSTKHFYAGAKGAATYAKSNYQHEENYTYPLKIREPNRGKAHIDGRRLYKFNLNVLSSSSSSSAPAMKKATNAGKTWTASNTCGYLLRVVFETRGDYLDKKIRHEVFFKLYGCGGGYVTQAGAVELVQTVVIPTPTPAYPTNLVLPPSEKDL
jgi:hypothetical protein